MAVLRVNPKARHCTRCMTRATPLSHPTLGDICVMCMRPFNGAPPMPLSKKERRDKNRSAESRLVQRVRAAAEPNGHEPHRFDVQAWGKKNVRDSKRWRIYERDGHCCVACGWKPGDPRAKGEQRRHLTLDHIIPRCKGGTNAESNLQTMCNRCNSLKGDKYPGWEERQRAKDRAASIVYREQHGQRPRKELVA